MRRAAMIAQRATTSSRCMTPVSGCTALVPARWALMRKNITTAMMIQSVKAIEIQVGEDLAGLHRGWTTPDTSSTTSAALDVGGHLGEAGAGFLGDLVTMGPAKKAPKATMADSTWRKSQRPHGAQFSALAQRPVHTGGRFDPNVVMSSAAAPRSRWSR